MRSKITQAFNHVLHKAAPALLASVMLLALVSCGAVKENDSIFTFDEEKFAEPGSDSVSKAGAGLESMDAVSQNDNYALWMNMATAEFCVRDLKSGQDFYSNPVNWKNDARAADSYKPLLGSQLVLDYYTPENLPGQMTSYTNCFLRGQLKISKITDGVRVDYQIGVANPQHIYPAIIRESELKKITSKLDEDAAADVDDAYRAVNVKDIGKAELNELSRKYKNIEKYGTVYELRADLGARLLKDVEAAFKEAGYSVDKATVEQQTMGYVNEDTETACFFVPVEYKIDEKGFTAEILSDEMKYTKGFSLTSISLLPFFAAADSRGQGYFVVPDGSGALINLNKSLTDGQVYSQSIYGRDKALQYMGDEYRESAPMPILGIKTEDWAVLGIVEQGEANGRISATLSGAYSTYNSICACFGTKQQDFLSDQRNPLADKALVSNVLQSKDRFKVRYFMLDGKHADYTAMAVRYGDYLKEQGSIKSVDSTMPFYLELVGAIEKRKNIMGIPLNISASLTTFNQAQTIIEELMAEGVGGIKLLYTGWANGGLKNSVYSSAEPLSSLGGKADFKRLINYTAQHKIAFYPDAELTYIYKDGLFDAFSSTSDAVRQINRQVSLVDERYISTNGAVTTGGTLSAYVLTPDMISKTLISFIKDYERFGLKSVSLKSLGGYHASDFREDKPVTATQGMRKLQEALDKLGGYDIVLETGNQALLKYSQNIVNLPLASSGTAIENQSIPFYQIALRGTVCYAGTPVNMAGDYRRAVLKAAETGAALYVRLMYEDSSAVYESGRDDLYSLSYKTWIKDITETYRRYRDELGDAWASPIAAHGQQGEITKTTYGNGKTVYVNYSDDDGLMDGIMIPALDYVVTGGM